MIGRRPRPVFSHSLLYNLPPVPRIARYQCRWCIFSQREYILNHIKGDLGPLKYPFQIVVSDRPHLVYEASLQDLLEPAKEVIIAFIYRAENSNNVFCSRTLPHRAFEWTHSRRVQMDGILEGGVPPKSCTPLTVTVDKIVVALGEEWTVGMTTTTTSKSPGNTTTTTRMTVTIKDAMPQGIETMVEREVQNNIDNNGNVGIEMVDAAGEAGGMAVQSSNRRRREKEGRGNIMRERLAKVKQRVQG